MKFLARQAIKTWARSGIAPGLCYQAIERAGPALAAKQEIDSRFPGGAIVQCDLRDHVQRQVYFWGVYELVEVYVFAHLLRPGMNFVDAGANIGQYSMIASKLVGYDGRAYAFEPIPQNYLRLESSLQRNGISNVEVIHNALWDSKTKLSMGREAQHKDNAGTFRVMNETGGEIQAVDFDGWSKSHGVSRIGAIKIDVEGAELRVLKGMSETLKRDHPFVIVEMQNESSTQFGNSPSDIHRFLLSEGYRCWQISEKPQDRRWIGAGEKWTSHNLLFHVGELPEILTRPWNWKTALHWLRHA